MSCTAKFLGKARKILICRCALFDLGWRVSDRLGLGLGCNIVVHLSRKKEHFYRIGMIAARQDRQDFLGKKLELIFHKVQKAKNQFSSCPSCRAAILPIL
jgi:hypothetical protein